MTDKERIKLLTETLERVSQETYHEPDIDSREYCAGCGHSPYHRPAHTPGCLTVAVCEALRACSAKPKKH